MSTFFHGWRRKMGCGLLLVASVLVMGWARSYYIMDWIVIQDAGFVASSLVGRIEWNWKWHYEVPGQMIEWHANPISSIRPEYFGPDYRGPDEVPYWSIAAPLTLLSAYLILWPGKRPKPPHQNRPTAPTAAVPSTQR